MIFLSFSHVRTFLRKPLIACNSRFLEASFDFQQPYAHAAYFSRLATFVPEYPVEALRAATAKVTRDAVRKFSELLRSEEQTFFGQVGP